MLPTRILAVGLTGALAAWACVAPVVVHAQLLHVQNYIEGDGLPGSQIHSVAQDGDGLIWFATRNGVVSYDGAHWRRSPTDWVRPSSSGYHLETDASGRIWAAGGYSPIQLAYWADGAWQGMPRLPAALNWEFPPEHPIYDLSVRGTNEAMLISGSLVAHWADDRWRISRPPHPSLLPLRQIERIDDEFHVATSDGVWRVPRDGEPWERTTWAPHGEVLAFSADGESVWLMRPEGIERAKADPFVFPLDWNWEPRGSCAPDGAGGLWFGDARSLFHLSPRRDLMQVNASHGIVASGTYDILVDREANVWCGTPRGVSKITCSPFRTYRREQGLYEDEVVSLLERRDGTIVAGHHGAASFFTEDGITTRDFALAVSPLVEARILDMALGADDSIWLAAHMSGLVRLRPSGEIERVPLPVSAPVNSVEFDAAGTLWVATTQGLLQRLDDGSFVSEQVWSGPEPYHFARRVQAGSDGSLWLCSSNWGVARRDREGRWRTYSAETDAGNSAYGVLEREDGVWVGTWGGLYRVDGESLIPETRFRIERPVYSLLEGSNGSFWFGTDFGVFRWNGRELERFGTERGFAGLEANRAATLVDSRGRVWLGTANGVSVWDETRERPTVPPRVEIVGVSQAGIERAFTDRFDARAGLVFALRAPSFVNEGELRFRYRLDGEGAWEGPHALPERLIRYASISPGPHRLEVQVIDVAGHASEIARSPEFVVDGPFWTRPEFWLLALFVAAGIIASLVSAIWQSHWNRHLKQEVRAQTRALVAEKQRLEATLRSSADGVLTTDASQLVMSLNPAGERILGITAPHAVGRPVRDVLFADGGTLDKPTSWCGKLGRPEADLLLEVSGAPIGDESRRGCVYVFRDITERERLQHEIARSRHLESVGGLAAGIAHDFNNLLAVMLGNLSILEHFGEMPVGDRKLVDEAQIAGRRAKGLTAQLLTFARGGAPVRKVASIEEIVEDCASFTFAGSSVGFRFVVPEPSWPLELDVDQIGQVLQNVLVNAREAMPQGGQVTVTVRNVAAVDSELGRDAVQLEIVDDGPGIAEEDLERIFEPNFSTRPHSSGFGLVTARSIVEAHQGVIDVDSAPGRGSSFRIVLPAAARDVALPARPATVEPGEGRVLVMDDEASVLHLVSRMLEQLGYEAVQTSCGEDAVDEYRGAFEVGRPFAAVLLDLTVATGQGGAEAARQILDLDPHAPLIVTSGYSQDAILADPAAHGFRTGLSKPFQIEDLSRILASVAGSTRPSEAG